MYNLPDFAQKLTPYEPLSGVFSVRLDANESCVTPSAALEARIAAAVAAVPLNRYPDPYAAELLAAFSTWQATLGKAVPPRFLTAGNGSDELIALLFTVFLREGETAAVLPPDFSMYRFYAELNGVNVLPIQRSSGHIVDPELTVAAAKRSGARMIIFSTPCNPVGNAAELASVRYIVENAGDCLVVIDEAYADFCPEKSIIGEVSKYDNLIVLKTMSKLLGAAGARCGFAVTNERLTKILRAAKSPYNVNAYTQAICAEVLRDTAAVELHRLEILRGREDLREGLSKAAERYAFEIFPSDANFIYAQTPNAAQIKEVLAAKSIAVRSFDNPSALRITVGTAEENAALRAALG